MTSKSAGLSSLMTCGSSTLCFVDFKAPWLERVMLLLHTNEKNIFTALATQKVTFREKNIVVYRQLLGETN